MPTQDNIGLSPSEKLTLRYTLVFEQAGLLEAL